MCVNTVLTPYTVFAILSLVAGVQGGLTAVGWGGHVVSGEGA